MSCVVWHFIHQGTNSYCLYLTRSKRVQKGQEHLRIKILLSFQSRGGGVGKARGHPLNGKGREMFALLAVMHRINDKRALNHSVSVIDCLETWKPYE